jgi:DNA-binding NtrC family response regulator
MAIAPLRNVMTSAHTQDGAALRRVVIFDPDPAARSGLADLLAEDGLGAVPCADVTSALSALDRADALVVDQGGTNGALGSFLREVATRAPALPVFVVTPYGDTEGWLATERLAPRACFAKPVPYEDLLEALRDCLDATGSPA